MSHIVKYRYYFFAFSLLVIVPGLIAMLVWGIPLAIDFTGGSLLEISFPAGQVPASAQVLEVYNQNGFPDAEVQTTGNNTLVIRSKEMSEDIKTQIVDAMNSKFGTTGAVQRFDNVGPAVGREVALRAMEAVLLAAVAIMGYITYAFRGVPHAFRYGVAAIIAMFHDVFVVLGVQAILGHFLGWDAGALFLTALLTVIGFSVHDTIVVFDRIRENTTVYKRLQYETLVNHSIVQTLARSINTQLTVMFTLLALVLFGGITIRHFVIILLIGIMSGTYSSIFNAAPILVVWENKEWRYWFRRRTPQTVS